MLDLSLQGWMFVYKKNYNTIYLNEPQIAIKLLNAINFLSWLVNLTDCTMLCYIPTAVMVIAPIHEVGDSGFDSQLVI